MSTFSNCLRGSRSWIIASPIRQPLIEALKIPATCPDRIKKLLARVRRAVADSIFSLERSFQKTASIRRNCGAYVDRRATDTLNFHWETAKPALEGSYPASAQNLLA